MLIYRILSILLYPFIEIYLIGRVRKGKEDKKRLTERLGKSSKARPQGEVIHLHAVSVGEANSALILVEELLKTFPKISILFTTTTLTSAAIIAEKLPKYEGRVIHQFLPVDSYFCVQNFFDFWTPASLVIFESEIWPNIIFESNKRDIPCFLVNARMSEKSARKWFLMRKIGFKIFDLFSVIFAQTNGDKNRLQKLAKKEVLMFGNLKAQAQNLIVNEEKLIDLKAQINNRKIFVCASTHKGEEEVILDVFSSLKKEFNDLLLILILRHPNRATEVKNLLKNFKFSQRSVGEKINESCEIYLVDTLGELGIFYALADFAFIGGSLKEIGGHNPFEAIKLDAAVISGKNVFNFAEIYSDLEKSNACFMVENGQELIAISSRFLREENLAKEINERAKAAINLNENIVQKIVNKIGDLAGL
jgi:3-deoxy-D-manno-octulosonic-acid transferase